MLNIDINQLRDAVTNSTTWTNVCRVLNIEHSEGIASMLRYECNKNDIKHDHFIGTNKRDINNYFNNKYDISSHQLKLLLFENFIKEPKCECCGITEWQGKPAPLELHHKDGNGKNNALDNLQILCCNCHASTENYRSKNKKYKEKPSINDNEVVSLIRESYTKREVILKAKLKGFKLSYPKIDRIILQNNVSFLKQTNEKEQIKIQENINEIRKSFVENGESYTIKENSTWRNEPKLNQRRVIRPPREELEKLIKDEPFLKIGERFGVTDNSIRKWCKYYQIEVPNYPKGYWRRREVGMTHEEALNPPPKPEKLKVRQLTLEQVATIKRRLLNGERIKKLSEEYQFSYECIRDIKYQRTYRTVEPAP